ncbi:MAG: hypothetical protein HDR71_16615 [Lachnospiraceae bacterium]|nr:hypothetical protein [Lachnospiraceae bacterium]
MNSLFLILFCISFLCIPVFVLWALINLIQKKPARKRFKLAGISAIALIVSTIGFGFTMDNIESTEPAGTVIEDSVAVAESPTLQPTIAPTVKPTEAPTPVPTETPTPKPTASPTTKPTNSPTPQTAEAPIPQSTETPTAQPTETPQGIDAPVPQSEDAPNTQIITESTPQPAAVSDSQSVVAYSSGNSGSGSGVNNFDTYDNQSQQQTTDAYVLNTHTKKIHYPSCSSVPKIAPQNYATSNASLEELEAQDYKPCGNCFK